MNTVELGQFTLSQMRLIQTTSHTQLVGDSHTFVTPTGPLPTQVESRVSQQAYNRYLAFDPNSPLTTTLEVPPGTLFPIARIPNIPSVFSPRHNQSCITCASASCVCAHMVSLSITTGPLTIPEEMDTITTANSSYRVTLYRPAPIPSDQRQSFPTLYATPLHFFAVPIGTNRDYSLYKSTPPHFLQVPPNSFFVFDGPVFNPQMHFPFVIPTGYPDPSTTTPVPTVSLQITLASTV